MLNVVALQGRLVADPELKSTQNGVPVCSFRLAVDRNFTDVSGNRVADFLDCVAWRQTAEFLCKYFAKGQMVALSGALQARSYEDRQGNKRTDVEVVASQVNFCGPKPAPAEKPIPALAPAAAPAPAIQGPLAGFPPACDAWANKPANQAASPVQTVLGGEDDIPF